MPRPAPPTGEPGLLRTLRADAAELAGVKGDSSTNHGAADILSLPGFWCVVLWRLGNRWHHRGLRPLSRLAYFANLVLFGADLASGAHVGPGVVIPHPVGVACASGTVLGSRVKLMGQTRVGGSGHPDRPGFPVVGDDVWLMDGAKVFGPVAIGDRVVVAASTVVTQDVGDDQLVLGGRTTLELRPRAAAASTSGTR